MSENENGSNESMHDAGASEYSEDLDDLRWAVVHDDLTLIERLIKKNVDINNMFQYDVSCGVIACDPPKTALMIAANRGKAETVAYLLKAGADPLIVNDGRYWNALHYACSMLHLDTVKVLLETTKLNINLEDYEGCTPLMRAIFMLGTSEREDTDIIQYLIENGADVHHKNHYGINSLHIASEFGLINCVKALIKANVDVNSKRGRDNATPLIIASYNRNEEVISYLLESGGKIDETNDKGNTALHEAVKQKSYECLKRLLKANAAINVKNNDGKTPLMLAVENKKLLESVPYLLEAGADVTLKDNN